MNDYSFDIRYQKHTESKHEIQYMEKLKAEEPSKQII